MAEDSAGVVSEGLGREVTHELDVMLRSNDVRGIGGLETLLAYMSALVVKEAMRVSRPGSCFQGNTSKANG